MFEEILEIIWSESIKKFKKIWSNFEKKKLLFDEIPKNIWRICENYFVKLKKLRKSFGVLTKFWKISDEIWKKKFDKINLIKKINRWNSEKTDEILKYSGEVLEKNMWNFGKKFDDMLEKIIYQINVWKKIMKFWKV